MARQAQVHLHTLFRWSVGRDIIKNNPVANLPKHGTAVKRERVLSDEELARVWEPAVDWPFGAIVRLLILTGARRDEIGALRWSELQGDKIELAGARTKNGEPRTIPLSPLAQDIIKALPHFVGSEFVFTTKGKSSVSGWSKAKTRLDKALGDHVAPWRLHDLRRTIATGMQRMGVNLQVVEAILGHVSGSRAGVVGVYQRYAYEPEKKAALDLWANHVAKLVGANVIDLRTKE